MLSATDDVMVNYDSPEFINFVRFTREQYKEKNGQPPHTGNYISYLDFLHDCMVDNGAKCIESPTGLTFQSPEHKLAFILSYA